MKRIALLLIFIGAIIIPSLGGVGGCGGENPSDNPPNIEGTYLLTNTDCPGIFDTEVDVVQTGSAVVIQATHAGFADISAKIFNDGSFETTSTTSDCKGQFASGVATVTCTESGATCHLTYNVAEGEILLGSFAYRPDMFPLLSPSSDESLCNSSCHLTFYSPIRVFENFDTDTILVKDVNDTILFLGPLNADDTFDFSFSFFTDQEQTMTDTMQCSGAFTQGCGLDLIRAACSSITTGACKLFFESL